MGHPTPSPHDMVEQKYKGKYFNYVGGLSDAQCYQTPKKVEGQLTKLDEGLNAVQELPIGAKKISTAFLAGPSFYAMYWHLENGFLVWCAALCGGRLVTKICTESMTGCMVLSQGRNGLLVQI